MEEWWRLELKWPSVRLFIISIKIHIPAHSIFIWLRLDQIILDISRYFIIWNRLIFQSILVKVDIFHVLRMSKLVLWPLLIFIADIDNIVYFLLVLLHYCLIIFINFNFLYTAKALWVITLSDNLIWSSRISKFQGFCFELFLFFSFNLLNILIVLYVFFLEINKRQFRVLKRVFFCKISVVYLPD